MSKEITMKALISGLHDELVVYQRLLNLLIEQYRLMSKHDSQALQSVNERETQLLALLYQRSKQRSLWLKELGFEADDKGMSRFIASLPIALQQRVEPIWSKMYQQLRLCQAQNEQNSRLLASQRDTLDRLFFGRNNLSGDYGALAHGG